MKYLLLVSFVLLVIASWITRASLPVEQAKHPVLYWVTDSNPARQEQIQLFQQWLIDHHYPEMELRLDIANNDDSKKVIQGVSGVGADIIDTPGATLRYLHVIGLLKPQTDPAAELGYSMDKTWPAARAEIGIADADGVVRQYGFPCNVFSPLFVVNRETLRKHNIPLPPADGWSAQEFERLGKAFVATANKDMRTPKYFFADMVEWRILARSNGAGLLNETMTASRLDHPEMVAMWQLYRKWMMNDHIIPSEADRSNFATDSGYGGQSPQLFNDGHYAMLFTGRHLVIQFREFDKDRVSRGMPLLDLGTAQPPSMGFSNTSLQVRSATVYVDGQPDLAKYFLAFLASAPYNQQIISSGDSVPPVPEYAKTEAYLHPPEHPNEWDLHGPFADAASRIAVPQEYSPFVLFAQATTEENRAMSRYISNELPSAQAAASEGAQRINQMIQRRLEQDPTLLPEYQRLVAIQKQIDARRAAGEPVPAEWITNPFYQRYYAWKGWISP